MPSSVRHPEVFRRAFVDALSLLHVESVLLRHSIPGEPDSPLVPTRVPGAQRRVDGPGVRNVYVRGTAKLALAVDLCASLDATGYDWSCVEPRSGVPYNYAFRLASEGAEGGGPGLASYFVTRAGQWPSPDGGAVGPHPPGSGYNSRALDLVNEAMATWAWLDENVFTPLDATLAAQARAVVASARASYVAQLNAKFGAVVYS